MNIQPASILIVDDLSANLRLLASILRPAGYEVRAARNGTAALASAQAVPPDLILLDIMMPELDGYEVCRRLKADRRTGDIPVIFISAIDELGDKVKAFQVGGVDYMTKPIQAEEVLARVKTHLSLRRLQQELQVQNRRLQDELALAREIQYSLLPAPRPDWPQLDLICYTAPAREVGGDFYTYHGQRKERVLLDKYILAVGDVSGKGVSAALLMAASLSRFDASLSLRLTPTERMAYLDRSLRPYTRPRRQNCAMCYVEIVGANTGQPLLKVINAGCIPPYIKRKDGSVEWPEAGGFALGQGLGAKSGYEETRLKLLPGDMIILVSDGVVEANNNAREMFGFARLEQAIAVGPTQGAQTMLEYLKGEIAAFVGSTEPHDDLTIVVAQL